MKWPCYEIGNPYMRIGYMPNILSLVKNLFYNLGTIDPVGITVELPQKYKI